MRKTVRNRFYICVVPKRPTKRGNPPVDRLISVSGGVYTSKNAQKKLQEARGLKLVDRVSDSSSEVWEVN